MSRGADGIIVSNHGGRQLDGAVASIRALPGVVEAVGGRAPVLIDGGFRRGVDVVKALALGARAVMIGRPHLWGVACAGEDGVFWVLELFRREIDRALALGGWDGIARLDASIFFHRPPEGAERPRGLGACLLNPGEMGFEPLKPVGELDAANSRIRFDVRVEALRPSFVAPFPRWRSSAGCECGQGRGPPLGELQDIVGEADEAPLVGDLLDAAQEKLTEAARLLDLSEHRLGQLLS